MEYVTHKFNLFDHNKRRKFEKFQEAKVTKMPGRLFTLILFLTLWERAKTYIGSVPSKDDEINHLSEFKRSMPFIESSGYDLKEYTRRFPNKQVYDNGFLFEYQKFNFLALWTWQVSFSNILCFRFRQRPEIEKKGLHNLI